MQGLLILVCVGVYAKLVRSIVISGNPIGAIWTLIGYAVLLASPCSKQGALPNPSLERTKDFRPTWPEVQKEFFQ